MAKSPSPLTAPAAAPERAERAANTLPALRVSYYRRMSPQRVYAVNVGWYKPEQRRPPAGTKPVLLRLLMAGAQVVPSEQPLDPARADAKATFFVTPLAKGWLCHERLEVLVDGRKVQDMPLPAKVTSQKMTWIFLILMILVPWFLLSWCRYSPIGIPPKKGRPGTPGQVMQGYISENLPPTPDLPEAAKDLHIEDALVAGPEYAGKFYELLWLNSADGHYLPYYTALFFLVLTLLSWLAHTDRRRRKVGKPIPLPTGPAPGAAVTQAEDFI